VSTVSTPSPAIKARRWGRPAAGAWAPWVPRPGRSARTLKTLLTLPTPGPASQGMSAVSTVSTPSLGVFTFAPIRGWSPPRTRTRPGVPGGGRAFGRDAADSVDTADNDRPCPSGKCQQCQRCLPHSRAPRVSALLRGKHGGFSTGRLLHLLNAPGQDVAVVVRPRGRAKGRAGTRVGRR
jgi:hypothetical protein